MQIIYNKMIQVDSDNAILNFIYNRLPFECNLCERSLRRYYKLFFQVMIKLKQFFKNRKNRPPPRGEYFNTSQFINYIQHFSSQARDGTVSGAVSLSDFYYVQQGYYTGNARFLFGTASQFR